MDKFTFFDLRVYKEAKQLVREVYSLGGRLQDYVPEIVEKALIKHYKK